jgi:hypothetical protein
MKANRIALAKFSAAGFMFSLMALWLLKSTKPFNAFAYGILAVMLIVIGFVIYSGIQALRDAKSGLNPIDELSQKLSETAAAIAFKWSIFMWLIILFVLDMFSLVTVKEAKFVIAIGMMVMVLIFFFTRLYLSKVGIHDDKD